MGPPGSRAKSLRTCSGSLTTQGPIVSRDNDTTSVAFRFWGQRRHPKVYYIFRGSITLPVHPLSTLRPYPYGYPRMTRGRCGSLFLHRLELPSITLCRFSGATPKIYFISSLSVCNHRLVVPYAIMAESNHPLQYYFDAFKTD